MLLCACLIVPVFLINYLHADNFGKWIAIGLLSLRPPHTRAGRPTSSPRPRICSRAAPSALLPNRYQWPEPSAAPLSTISRSHPANFAQLFDPLHHCSHVISHRYSFWSCLLGLKKVESVAMSLYCAVGSAESDLSSQRLKDLLAESLSKLGERNRVLAVASRPKPANHPRAGELTRYAWKHYGEPAQGDSARAGHARRHAPRTDLSHVRRCAPGTLPRP